MTTSGRVQLEKIHAKVMKMPARVKINPRVASLRKSFSCSANPARVKATWVSSAILGKTVSSNCVKIACARAGSSSEISPVTEIT